MKKFMVRCDMEGASGVVSYEQAEPRRSEYAVGQRRFMRDLVALIGGLKEGGAEEIHVYDEHCSGRNILLEELPDLDGLRIYAGKPPYRAECPGGLDESFEGLILLGLHSKRGSEGCLLQHSYEPDIADIRIDGISVGEIGTEARIAADFGVPLVMITADSAGIAEAEAFGGKTCRYVCVKESLSESGAICYPTAVTSRKIFEAARQTAAESHPRVGNGIRNAKLELRFFDTPYAAEYKKRYGEPVFGGAPLSALWCGYQARKLAILAAGEEKQ